MSRLGATAFGRRLGRCAPTASRNTCAGRPARTARRPAHLRASVAALAVVAGLLAAAQPAPAQSITVVPSELAKVYGGRTATYTVVLDTEPSTNVTVKVSVLNLGGPVGGATADTDPDTPGDQDTLTFSRLNWSTTQTVTVAATRYEGTYAHYYLFTYKATSGAPEYRDVQATVAVQTGSFDGTIESTWQGKQVPVPEGGSTYFFLRLTAPPTGDVTLTMPRTAVGDDDMIADTDPSTPGDQTTLIVTTANWDDYHTVHVRGREDADAVPGRGKLPITATGGEYDHTWNQGMYEVENDSAALVLTPPSVTVRENSTAIYTVRLASRPTTDVTVAVARNLAGDVHLSAAPTTLTFTTDNWSTSQPVTLTADDDVDAMNGTATFVHTAAGGDYAGLSRGLIAEELDDDARGQGFTPLNVSVPEGSTATYTVSVGVQPTTDVTVTVTRTGDADLTVDTDPNQTGDQNTLTFTRTNYTAAQTVIVAAAVDLDTANSTATFTHTATGGNYEGLSKTTTATEIDDDFAALVVTPALVTVAEGATATYTVRLATRPDGDVTVRWSRLGDTDLTAAPATLTFTTTNATATQTVTVTAAEDDDGANGSALFTILASGYAPTVELLAVEADNDRALLLSPRSVAVAEGSTATYTVRLATLPNAPVTVTITRSAGDADLTVDTDPDQSGNQNALTFTVAGWSTSQTVTVRAADDIDGVDDSATFSHAAAGGQHDGVTAALTAAAADDDRAVRVAPPSVALTEGGSSATYTVRLAAAPTTGVTVTVRSDDAGAVTAAPASLTFSTTTWSTSQTVVLTPVQDPDGEDESVTITNTPAGAGFVTPASVAATVDDDEVKGVLLSTTRVALTEGGSTASYTVRLTTRPTTGVTVTVVSAKTAAVTAAPPSLTFSTSTWSTSQTVVLTPVQDPDGEDETVAISNAAAGGGYGESADVTATVADDDAKEVLLSTTSVALTEGGSTASYTVRLTTLPTTNVTVTVSSGDAGAVTATPTTLTFSTTTWSTSQTVVLTPVDDADGRDESVAISHTAAAGGYGAVTVPGVTTAVADDDRAVLVFPDALALTEGGSSATYTVRLATEPTTGVTVTVVSAKTGAVIAAPASMTFSTTTWSTSQTVVLTPVEDLDGEDESVTVTNTAGGGGYGESAAVAATVADDDVKGVLLSTTSVALTEGGSTASYTVRLTTLPTTNVTVTVSSGAAGAVTAAPASMTFSTATWSTSQTVVLTPVEDADGRDESVAISHAAANGGYGSVTVPDVTATVADDDRAVLVFPYSVALTEGGSTASYTVRLATQPTTGVTVTVVSDKTAAVTAAPPSLTFSTTTWSTSQTVVLTPVDDLDGENESVPITNTADGGGYGESAAVTATVADDDVKGVLLSTTRVALTEGGSTGSYTVRLATRPTTDVTVTVRSDDAGAVTTAPASLTFSTATWNTSQTVVLTPVDDADGRDESVAISHAAANGGYGAVTVPGVTATVTDDDRAVLVFPDAIALTEGGSTASYTVRLATEPTTNVTVTVRSDDAGAVTAAPASLTFSTTTWSTSQTVVLTAVEDPDGEDETVPVTNTAAGGGYVESAAGHRHGGRRRRQGSPVVDHAGGAHRGRVDGRLHGAPDYPAHHQCHCHRAQREDRGGHRGAGVADLLHVHLEHLADRGPDAGGRRRRPRRARGDQSYGSGWRLRLGHRPRRHRYGGRRRPRRTRVPGRARPHRGRIECQLHRAPGDRTHHQRDRHGAQREDRGGHRGAGVADLLHDHLEHLADRRPDAGGRPRRRERVGPGHQHRCRRLWRVGHRHRHGGGRRRQGSPAVHHPGGAHRGRVDGELHRAPDHPAHHRRDRDGAQRRNRRGQRGAGVADVLDQHLEHLADRGPDAGGRRRRPRRERGDQPHGGERRLRLGHRSGRHRHGRRRRPGRTRVPGLDRPHRGRVDGQLHRALGDAAHHGGHRHGAQRRRRRGQRGAGVADVLHDHLEHLADRRADAGGRPRRRERDGPGRQHRCRRRLRRVGGGDRHGGRRRRQGSPAVDDPGGAHRGRYDGRLHGAPDYPADHRRDRHGA